YNPINAVLDALDRSPFRRVASGIRGVYVSPEGVVDDWIEIGGGGNPAFQNSWANYGLGNNATAGFRKDGEGTVHIKGMVKNHSLAKSIADAGWSQFVRFVEYKGEWYGTYVEKIDRFFASSKICSDCRAKNALLKISDREWACSECGVLHDRDVNAAINILNWNTVGTTEIDACGQNVRQLSVLNDDCSLDEARSPTPSGLGCSLYRWR
ncbi:hypothetical protein LCGC14_2776410, partial [marine sediment metagenome]